MDTTLVTVTILSMGMAAALSVIVWRMLRDERQRSDARVAALAAAAAPATQAAEPCRRCRPAAAVTPPSAIERRCSSSAARRSPWGNRLAVMGAIGLVLGAWRVVLFAMSATAARGPRAPSSRQHRRTAAAVDTAVSAGARAALAARHAQLATR